MMSKNTKELFLSVLKKRRIRYTLSETDDRISFKYNRRRFQASADEENGYVFIGFLEEHLLVTLLDCISAQDVVDGVLEKLRKEDKS